MTSQLTKVATGILLSALWCYLGFGHVLVMAARREARDLLWTVAFAAHLLPLGLLSGGLSLGLWTLARDKPRLWWLVALAAIGYLVAVSQFDSWPWAETELEPASPPWS